MVTLLALGLMPAIKHPWWSRCYAMQAIVRSTSKKTMHVEAFLYIFDLTHGSLCTVFENRREPMGYDSQRQGCWRNGQSFDHWYRMFCANGARMALYVNCNFCVLKKKLCCRIRRIADSESSSHIEP